MPEYQVTWTIEVDAASPREAAEKARAAQFRLDTTATVFQVKPWGHTTQPPESVDIDLGEEFPYFGLARGARGLYPDGNPAPTYGVPATDSRDRHNRS